MFITFLTSISKVAIVAFLFTFIAILIELFLISRKDSKKKEKKDVVLPAFNDTAFKPLQQSKNVPLTVKKAKIDRAPHELSPKYVIGLIGLCFVVFIAVAGSIMYKGSQNEQVPEQALGPTQSIRPTFIPQVSPTEAVVANSDEVAILDIDSEELTNDDVQTLAQAPSPTPFTPTNSPTPTDVIVAPVTATPTSNNTPTVSVTTTPTRTGSPTLLQTGGDYNASLFAAVISFALIAFAFMF